MLAVPVMPPSPSHEKHVGREKGAGTIHHPSPLPPNSLPSNGSGLISKRITRLVSRSIELIIIIKANARGYWSEFVTRKIAPLPVILIPTFEIRTLRPIAVEDIIFGEH